MGEKAGYLESLVPTTEGQLSKNHHTSIMARKRQRRRRRKVTRSQRAELQFPVSRVDRFLREGNYSRRLSSSAPVSLAGVLEYLTSNILELAGEVAHTTGRKRIAPEHVCRVVQNNEQLHQLFKQGGTSVFEPPEPDDN